MRDAAKTAGGLPQPRNTSVQEMLGYVARFAELRGSEEAFVDSRLPGCRRRKINIIGNEKFSDEIGRAHV